MAGERMAAADAVWLRLERATNVMAVTGLLWFDGRLDWARLRKRVEARLVDRFPRFRQRVVESGSPLGGFGWEDDPGFELASHLERGSLPAPGDRRALERLLGELMAAPLDRRRPLWRLQLVDGYGDGCALVARFHHCIADPLTLARVLMSLTDERPDAPVAPQLDGEPRRARPAGLAALPGGALLSAARGAPRALLQAGGGIVTDPAKLVRFGALARDDAGALARLLTGRDPGTLLKGELGVERRVAWSAAIPLDRVKAIRRASAASVNDVLLAALAGALHRYLAARGGLVERLRAIVPFNLQPPNRPPRRRLGNRFGVVFLPLPVGLADPGERLAAVKREMAELNRSPAEGAVGYALLAGSGKSLPQLEKLVVDRLAARASAVMTNIPGPRETVYVAGAPLRGALVWAPCPSGLSVSVAIYSYDGQIGVGVATDAGLVPDPETITDQLEPELDALTAHAEAG